MPAMADQALLRAAASKASPEASQGECRSRASSISEDLLKTLGPPPVIYDTPNQLQYGIERYNPQWPVYFENIKAALESDLADGNVSYLAIEHIGSTAVPGLLSKAVVIFHPFSGPVPQYLFPPQAVIDICIVVAPDDFNDNKLDQFQDALGWGRKQMGYRYIGNGGVQDRWSFKLDGVTPLRNVYVVAEGSIPLRAYRSLRDTLRVDGELREEYAKKKEELVKQWYDNVMQYCVLKRPTIRKIFIKAGWTHEEVDEAEAQAKTEVGYAYEL